MKIMEWKTVLLFILTICLVKVLSLDTDIAYSNEWIIKTNMSENDLSKMATRHGFRLVRKLIDDQFLLIHIESPKTSRRRARLTTKNLFHHAQIEFVEQQLWRKRLLRASSLVIQDAEWNSMWYMNRSFQPSMEVLRTWTTGYTGSGITVAIVDNGVEFNHPDLRHRYIPVLSEDFYDNDKDPSPAQTDSHGTRCAGIAVAEKNNICVVGAAFESHFVAYRMIGPFGATQAGEVSALSKIKGIDIFSNSWGGDDKTVFEGPSASVKRALEYGCKKGRNGRGAIYVFAGGNGGYNDNCNCDGYVNSVYTIAINSISVDAKPPGYAEQCSAILASTFSGPGGVSTYNMWTTDVGGGCIGSFTGTSAATPMAAGIFALLLQANPSLTWRDVQELVVTTSSTHNLTYGDIKLNGVGRNVSDWFGYGMLDAQALIKAGETWRTLPEQNICRPPIKYVNTVIQANVKPRVTRANTTTDGCNFTANCVNSLEHVEVTVTFQSSLRGAVALTLTSPLGTVSKILTERSDDKSTVSQQWTYMSVQHWGEHPEGEWALDMSIVSDWRQSGESTQSKKPDKNIIAICLGSGGLVIIILTVICVMKELHHGKVDDARGNKTDSHTYKCWDKLKRCRLNTVENRTC